MDIIREIDIIREDNTQKGAFKALDGEIDAGKLTYIWSGPNRIIVDHTEVYSPYSGQGIGQQMVAAAVAFARENEVKILPLCAFTKKMMERDSSTHDVLFVPGSK